MPICGKNAGKWGLSVPLMEITEDFIRGCGQNHDLGNTWVKTLDALKISLGWSISPPKSTEFIINGFAQEYVKRCKILLLWKKLRSAWPQRPFHWTKHSIQVGPIFSSGPDCSSGEIKAGWVSNYLLFASVPCFLALINWDAFFCMYNVELRSSKFLYWWKRCSVVLVVFFLLFSSGNTLQIWWS